MGLKDWFARNVAGASAYGEVMGQECLKNGLAVGRAIYLGHGIRATPSERFVFKDGEEMESQGFELYCKDPLNRPAMENSSELSMKTRSAGIAFAVQLSLTASSNFMRNPTNRQDFQRSLGAGTKILVNALNSGPEMDRVMDCVMQFLKLRFEKNSQVLNMEDPGINDTLGGYLRELSKETSTGSVAFRQKGILGFDNVVVPLAQETVLKIQEACQKFHW